MNAHILTILIFAFAINQNMNHPINDKKRKNHVLTADDISELCREAEVKCDALSTKKLLPPHVRDLTEHYSKLFQMSPYAVAIQLISLSSFFMCKAKVEMKDIKFKQDCNIWSIVIGHSGGKKSVQHKTLNENLMMTVKNKSHSRNFSECDF